MPIMRKQKTVITQGGTALVSMCLLKSVEFKDIGATINGMAGQGVSGRQEGKDRQEGHCELERVEYLEL